MAALYCFWAQLSPRGGGSVAARGGGSVAARGLGSMAASGLCLEADA